MKKQIVASFAIVGMVVAGASVLSPLATVAKAQAPVQETSDQKIARLEKEVRALRAQVAQLKRGTPIYTLTTPSLQTVPLARVTPGVPFEFNGQTYYRMPLTKESTSAPALTPNQNVSIYWTPQTSVLPNPK